MMNRWARTLFHNCSLGRDIFSADVDSWALRGCKFQLADVALDVAIGCDTLQMWVHHYLPFSDVCCS